MESRLAVMGTLKHRTKNELAQEQTRGESKKLSWPESIVQVCQPAELRSREDRPRPHRQHREANTHKEFTGDKRAGKT